MIITFLTEIGDEDCPYESHSILMDGREIITISEGMEPEDVRFGRDLESPHQIEGFLLALIEAAQSGNAITIEHTEKE